MFLKDDRFTSFVEIELQDAENVRKRELQNPFYWTSFNHVSLIQNSHSDVLVVYSGVIIMIFFFFDIWGLREYIF